MIKLNKIVTLLMS